MMVTIPFRAVGSDKALLVEMQGECTSNYIDNHYGAFVSLLMIILHLYGWAIATGQGLCDFPFYIKQS